jgi:O-antigen ligase
VVAGIVLVLLVVPLAATQPDALDLWSRRMAALFSGGGDLSVAYRLELYPRLLEHISRRPMFGYGVGYPVDGLLFVENSYLYYALKVGLVGTLAVLMGWLWLLFSATRLAWDAATLEGRAVGAGWAAATAAILIITAINPFINSPVGLYFETMGMAIVAATLREPAVIRSVSKA